ncbi:MAG: hypothetical protein JW754_00375 [Candidatus Aenigmarchaeota archaeon]|nr:hypothetical protein [Candidatus Aenigmarchaeota archaeon]
MDTLRKVIIIAVVISVLNIVSVISGTYTGKMISKDRIFTVSELYSSVLLEDMIMVRGEVAKVLEDHVSEKGFHYQQFILSDGEKEIKFFCSVKYGEADVRKGDEVVVDGKFQEFYGELEIYGFCSEVRKM